MDRTFWEEYGLYRKYPYKVGSDMTMEQRPPAIQRYCSNCRGERTWFADSEHTGRVGSNPTQGRRFPANNESQPVESCCVGYEFTCTACWANSVIFVVYFGREENSDLTDEGYVMKVGQYPAWSIEPSTDLKAVLGQHEELYKRGTICESHGYGIGAFAYYRRIVEDIIGGMLDDIGELIESDERQHYADASQSVKDTIVAEKKIAVVKDMLPSSLRPGGVNPLALLHEALSVGIHELGEPDCLELAVGIRESLVMLAQHIAQAKRDRDGYARSITSVQDKLNKIKQKSQSQKSSAQNEDAPSDQQ